MSKFTRSHRYSLALIAGVATAVLLMAIAAPMTKAFYPDWGMKGFDHSATGPLLIELATWMVATFGGCLVTAKLAKDYPLLFCAIIGAILSYPLTRNILAVSGRPDWFVPACVIGIPLTVIAAWLLARLSSQGKVSTATQSTNE